MRSIIIKKHINILKYFTTGGCFISIIIKQHINIFKYSTRGGYFIRFHTSLAMSITFDFSKISFIPISIYANFSVFIMVSKIGLDLLV